MAATDVTKIVLDDKQYQVAARSVIKANASIVKSTDAIGKETAKLGAAGPSALSKLGGAAGGLPGPLGAAATSVKALTAAMIANPFLAVAAAVVALGSALASMTSGVTDNIDKITKLSESTGMAAASLSRYQQLAEKTLPSGEIDKLAEGFQRLAKVQADAAAGSELAQAKLDALSISGDTAEEQFASLADGYVSLGNTAERAIAMTDLFGNSLARELAPALALGAEGIRTLAEENDSLNRTFTEEDAARVAKYKDLMQELGAAFSGISQTIVNFTLPAINAILDVMTTSQDEIDFDTAIASVTAELKTAGEASEDLRREFGNLVYEGASNTDAIEALAQRRIDAAKAERAAVVEEMAAQSKAAQEAAQAEIDRQKADEERRKAAQAAHDQALKDRMRGLDTAAKEAQALDKEMAETASAAIESYASGTTASIDAGLDAFEIAVDSMLGTQEEFDAGIVASLDLQMVNIQRWAAAIAEISEAQQEKIDLGLETAQAASDALEAIATGRHNRAVAGAEKVARAEEDAKLKVLKATKGVTKAEIKLAEAAADARVRSAGEAVTKGEKLLKASFLFSQGLALTTVGIDTALGMQKAIAAHAENPVAGGIIAGAILASGIAAAAAITSATIGEFKTPSLTGGAGGGGSAAAAPSPTAGNVHTSAAAPPTSGRVADQSFDDTPGLVRASPGNDTFKFKAGDYVGAAQQVSDLAAQIPSAAMGSSAGVVDALGLVRRAIENQTELLASLVGAGGPLHVNMEPV